MTTKTYDTDPITKLYNTVKDQGLYTKSFDEFKTKYSNPEAIDKLYNVVSESQLYTKSKDEFVSKYFPAPVEKKSQVGGVSPSIGTGEGGLVPLNVSSEQVDENDIVGMATKAQELANKQIPSVAGGTGGAAVSFSPDEKAIAESKKIKEGLVKKGYKEEDIPELVKEFQDFPKEAFDLKDEQGNPKYSQENLLKLRKENPIDYHSTIGNLKNTFEILKKAGVNEANKFNQLHEESETFSEFAGKIKEQQRILHTYLQGEDLTKALNRVKESAAPYIDPTNSSLQMSYQSHPELQGKIDIDQYAGLKTLEIFEPERYKQVLKVLGTDIVPEYDVQMPTEATKYIQSPAAINTQFQTQDSAQAAQMGGRLAQSTIDQQIGKESINKMLGEVGRNNALVSLNKKQYDLNAAYDKETDESVKNQIASEYVNNQSKIEQIKNSKFEDLKKYPLASKLELDDLAKELTESSQYNVLNYGVNRFAKGFGNTQNTIEDKLIDWFGSDSRKTKLQMQRIGEESGWQSEMYLPEQFKQTNSQIIPQFSKEIKEKGAAIADNKSLPDADKKEQLRALISQGLTNGGVDFITNPNAGQSKNLFSKANLYGNVGLLGDIASIAAQSASLGGLGASKILAASAPMFTTSYSDFYNQALKEGHPNPEDYAMTHASIMAAAGLINPDLAIVKRSLGLKSALGKAISGVDEATWNRVVSANKPILDKFKNAGTSVFKEAAKMGAVYGVGTSIATDLANKGFFDKDISAGQMIDNAVTSLKHTTINSLALFGINSVMNFKSTPLEQKARLWEAGDNTDITIKQIDEAVKNNQITAEQGEQRKEVVNSISKLISKVPSENEKGKPLTDKQRINYLYNLYIKEKSSELKKSSPEQKKEILEGKSAQADVENNHILEGTNPKLIEIAPEEEKTFTYESETDIPKVLSGVKPVRMEEIKTEGGKKIKVTYSGEQLIDAGMAKKAQTKEDATLSMLREKAGEEERFADMQYFIDKAGETPAQYIEKYGPDITNELLAKVPTKKLLKNMVDAGKFSRDNPNVPILEAEIQRREAAEDTSPTPMNTQQGGAAENVVPSTLNVGGKVEWNVFGNEENSEWTVKETTTTRGGEPAVVLTQERNQYSEDGKHIIGKKTVEHVVPLSELKQTSPSKRDVVPSTLEITKSDWQKALKDTEDKTGASSTTEAIAELSKVFKDGDKVEFFAGKEREGTWDSKRNMIVDKDGNPWGLAGLFSEEGAYIKKIEQQKTTPTNEGGETIKPKEDAVSKQSTNEMDVRQQTNNGEGMGERNIQPEIPTGTQTPEEGQIAGEEKRTGIKNAVSESTRAVLDLPKVDVPKLGKDAQIIGEGKELVDSGSIEPQAVVERINSTNNHYMSRDEAKAMQYYMHQLGQHETQIREQLAQTEDPTTKANYVGLLGQLSDLQDAATEANIKAGKDWSDVGNIRQILVDQSFNPSREKAIIKDAYGGEIPKEAKLKIDAALKERDEAIAQRAKLEEQLREKEAALKAAQMQKEGKKTKTKGDFKERINSLKDELKAAKDEHDQWLKDQGIQKSGIGFTLTGKMAKVIGKIAAEYAKEGYRTVEELINKVYEEVKDQLTGIDKKHIRDAIAMWEAEKMTGKAERLEEKIDNPKEPVSKLKLKFKTNTAWVAANQRIANAEYKLKVQKRLAFESQKNMFQKGLMWAGRLTRLSVLSGYNVLYKLAAAATIGGAAKRIPEQMIGRIYQTAFKGISERAPIEGYINAKSEAKFYKEFFNPKKFVKNSWQILKTGESDLNKKFGAGGYEHVPLLYLPTDLHQVIKDPVKRATFEASLRNSMIWAEKNGLDINDPLVLNTLETAAYKRGNYEIFQESNWLSKKFSGWKAQIEKEGNVGAVKKFLADFMIPVSTVPTNIVRRLVTTSPLGLIRGGKDVVQAYRKGIEKLEPEQADAIMRQLKQGSLGTALWLVGWFGAAHFGGLYSKYNPNKQRDEGELASDEMEVDGKMIPKPVQHALPFEIIQWAATARHIYDNYKDKGASTFQSIYEAGMGSIGAVAEHIPIVETTTHVVGAFKNPYEAEKLKEDVVRRFQPQILRETGVISKDEKKSTGTSQKQTKSQKKNQRKQTKQD